MIIFTLKLNFQNLKRTYQGCKPYNEFENKRKCIEHRKYKKREPSPLCSCLFLYPLSVCICVCLSVYRFCISVSVTPLPISLFCVKILELLFSGETSLEGKRWWWLKDHTAQDAVETDLTLQVGSYFPPLSAINQLWASWQIISMGLNGHWKRLS